MSRTICIVIPAKAGISSSVSIRTGEIPACAGMTDNGVFER